MGEVTRLLEIAGSRDPEASNEALDEVFRRLHQELQALAGHRLRQARGQTLTPTALVNELYLKFSRAARLDIESEQHFFACAAAAMRQIVVDAARAASAGKRGGSALFVTLTDAGAPAEDTQILALDEAMEDLDALDSELRQLVELRFFAGLTLDEIARIKNRSARSLRRDWSRARAFLHAQLAS